MELLDEPTCIRNLTYRVEPADPLQGARVIRACVDAAWSHGAEIGQLHVFVDPNGHQVLVVPTTGRIQIRVMYTVPYEQRRLAAQALLDGLVSRIEACERTQGPAR
ncbi:MAG: hypothetical protein AB8I08_39115 [Sandaracinaceae bacterium]